MTTDLTHPPVGRLRAAILADPALQAELGAIEGVDDFLPRAIAVAQASGIAMTEPALRSVLASDPLGLTRFADGPPTADRPPPGWLPIQVAPIHGELCVDWGYFGRHVLREPFFEDSIRTILCRPFSRLARHRTRLNDLPACLAQLPVQRPSGFIFHMSRCGSTLAAQMLAADPRNVVISEAAPLDTMVGLGHAVAGLPPEAHVQLIRDIVGALGHRRDAAHTRLFVKLDSWHALALPLFRRAFPDVPWVFFYREPSDVLASQVLERGIQTVPEYMPPAIFGLTDDDREPSDAYCARVLARTCEAALAAHGAGGGLLVNYREMPDALFTRILPHFGIVPDAQARAAMTAAAQFDAKTPALNFAPRNDLKREILTDDLRAVADREIGPVYAALEALRGKG